MNDLQETKAAHLLIGHAHRMLARNMVENGWVALEPMPASWGIEQ